ncbi:MAG: UDP-N-acetylmuramoyl-tripeptide--D-alanyl-D-alanine ligase [Phycisphaerales bacterium]
MTRRALGQLALAYRRSLDSVRVIAVTGSNGKTTTVRLIDAVLREVPRRASIKSYNNDIGVPLTIFSARPGDQYLVCEVGMNAPGEIAPLARIVEPDVAVITSIGRAHIETFDDQLGIVREKASLLSFVRPHGLAVVTADCPDLDPYLKPVPNVVMFGRSDRADLRLTASEHAGDPPSRVRFTINERVTHEIPLLGEHNALNAMAAVAVGRRLGLEEEDIGRGLAGAVPAEMRLRHDRVGGLDLFNDAYNSSPESAMAAIRTFADLARAQRAASWSSATCSNSARTARKPTKNSENASSSASGPPDRSSSASSASAATPRTWPRPWPGSALAPRSTHSKAWTMPGRTRSAPCWGPATLCSSRAREAWGWTGSPPLCETAARPSVPDNAQAVTLPMTVSSRGVSGRLSR